MIGEANDPPPLRCRQRPPAPQAGGQFGVVRRRPPRDRDREGPRRPLDPEADPLGQALILGQGRLLGGDPPE